MPHLAEPEDPATIHCSRCQACCCQLTVLVMADDEVPESLIATDAHGMEVMRQLDDGWCVALDRNTLRCTIHAQRPQACREFAMGGSDCRAERASWRRIAASLA